MKQIIKKYFALPTVSLFSGDFGVMLWVSIPKPYLYYLVFTFTLFIFLVNLSTSLKWLPEVPKKCHISHDSFLLGNQVIDKQFKISLHLNSQLSFNIH